MRLPWTASRAAGSASTCVVVTGASGFVGTSLVRRLLPGHARVRVLVRSASKGKAFADQGAEVVVGEITDRTAVSAAFDGASVVYHLAGRLLVPGVSDDVYQNTHVVGTRVVVSCCEDAPALARFVHCSTTGVLGVTGDRPADEDAPLRPTNVYETTKAAAEIVVRDAIKAGLPGVIARPGLVYGPGDLHLLPFVRAVLGRRFRPIGRRAVWLHPIYIDDLSEALVRCAESSRAVGECFHLAGRSPAPLAELAQAIAAAGGTRLPSGHIPMIAAQAVAGLGDRLPPKVRPSAPLTRSRLDFLTHSRVYDVSKAQRLLDFSAPTELSTGAERTVAWYREHGYIRQLRAPEPLVSTAA